MKTFKVTDKEIAAAAISASLEYNKYKKVYKKKDVHRENFFFGKIGEIGYSKHSGKAYNFDFYAKKGDGGADFDGVQVKTVTWDGENKELKVNAGDKSLTNDSVGKFVLMYVDPGMGGQEAHIIGEISKENFMKKSTMSPRYEGARVLCESKLDIVY